MNQAKPRLIISSYELSRFIDPSEFLCSLAMVPIVTVLILTRLGCPWSSLAQC